MKFAGGTSRSERAQLQQSQISSVTPSGHQQPAAHPPAPQFQVDGKQQQQQQQEVQPPLQLKAPPAQEQKPQQLSPKPRSPARDDVVLKPGDLVQAMPKKTPPPVLPRQKTIDKDRAPPPPEGPLQRPPQAPPQEEPSELKAGRALSPQFNHHALGATDSLGGHEDLPCCRATMDLFPGGMAEESSNL